MGDSPWEDTDLTFPLWALIDFRLGWVGATHFSSDRVGGYSNGPAIKTKPASHFTFFMFFICPGSTFHVFFSTVSRISRFSRFSRFWQLTPPPRIGTNIMLDSIRGALSGHGRSPISCFFMFFISPGSAFSRFFSPVSRISRFSRFSCFWQLTPPLGSEAGHGQTNIMLYSIRGALSLPGWRWLAMVGQLIPRGGGGSCQKREKREKREILEAGEKKT